MTASDGGDGRNIDERLGSLEGEAADQASPAKHVRSQGSVPPEVWSGVPSEGGKTYFDRPTLKEPIWIWSVPVYFWIGGAAGAAAAIGAVAQTKDRDGLEDLIHTARWIAATGTAAGAGLLIYDLGRPERFMNMLRVFRPTSVLNMGSWVLASSGTTSGIAAIASVGGPRRSGDAAGIAAGVLGLPLSGYTAVLLSDTAIPLWQATRKSLPLLFVASALSSAADLLEVGRLDESERRIVKRLGVVGKALELVATASVERDANKVERVGRPLKEGPGGTLWRAAKVLTVAGLAASVVGKGRRGRLASAALGTAGALSMRFALFYAGKASARDPRATFQQQRAESS